MVSRPSPAACAEDLRVAFAVGVGGAKLGERVVGHSSQRTFRAMGDLDRCGVERRGERPADAGRLGGRRLLREPRDVGDAPGGGDGPGAGDARRADAVRGRGVGRGGRLRADGGLPGRDAAAPRAGLRERVRQRPQRVQGARRRWSTSSAITRSAHKPLGAPLASDIESVVRPVSHWVRTVRDARSAATDTALAVAAEARAGGVSTLIFPADAGWGPSRGPVGAAAGARSRRRCLRGRSRRPRAALRGRTGRAAAGRR